MGLWRCVEDIFVASKRNAICSKLGRVICVGFFTCRLRLLIQHIFRLPPCLVRQNQRTKPFAVRATCSGDARCKLATRFSCCACCKIFPLCFNGCQQFPATPCNTLATRSPISGRPYPLKEAVSIGGLFSNRPLGVKRLQTYPPLQWSDVAHGLVAGTKVFATTLSVDVI